MDRVSCSGTLQLIQNSLGSRLFSSFFFYQYQTINLFYRQEFSNPAYKKEISKYQTTTSHQICCHDTAGKQQNPPKMNANSWKVLHHVPGRAWSRSRLRPSSRLLQQLSNPAQVYFSTGLQHPCDTVAAPICVGFCWEPDAPTFTASSKERPPNPVPVLQQCADRSVESGLGPRRSSE